VLAAAILAAAAVHAAMHTRQWSVQPIPWIGRAQTQLLLAALVAVGLVGWLPAPRRGPLRGWGRAALWALPAVAVGGLAVQTVPVELRMRASERALAQVPLPLPPGAAEMRELYDSGHRLMVFWVAEAYPSTAVADFYERYFRGHGWSERGRAADWLYSEHPTPIQCAVWYDAEWLSPDGKTQARVSLVYLPADRDRCLPLDQWPKEWLAVQRVDVSLAPTDWMTWRGPAIQLRKIW
jgi:hypothetical protein